jgi:hypothetical protein
VVGFWLFGHGLEGGEEFWCFFFPWLGLGLLLAFVEGD